MKGKKYIILYALAAVIFLALGSMCVFFLTYYKDASHFSESVSAYMDPMYTDKEPMIVEYKARWYYPDFYEAAYITEDCIRGSMSSRVRQYFVDEKDYAELEPVIVRFGETATMTFYDLGKEGGKDVSFLKYEREGEKTTYYKIYGLTAYEHVLENIDVVNR